MSSAPGCQSLDSMACPCQQSHCQHGTPLQRTLPLDPSGFLIPRAHLYLLPLWALAFVTESAPACQSSDGNLGTELQRPCPNMEKIQGGRAQKHMWEPTLIGTELQPLVYGLFRSQYLIWSLQTSCRCNTINWIWLCQGLKHLSHCELLQACWFVHCPKDTVTKEVTLSLAVFRSVPNHQAR